MLRKGCEVIHTTMPEWGIGIIMEDESHGRVSINFERGGKKELDLNFAKLEEVGIATGPCIAIGAKRHK